MSKASVSYDFINIFLCIYTVLQILWKYQPQFSSVQLLSCVQLFAIPWTAAHQASLSITISWSLLKLMSIESVMPSNHLILYHPLLLLPPIPPSISLFQWVNSAWGGQSTGVSALASFLPKKSQGWSPSEWTGWISLQLVKWYLTYVVKQNALAIPGMESCGHFPQGKKRAHTYMKYGAHNSEISSPSWEALLWRLYENHW